MALALAVIGVICILYGIAVLATASGTWFFAFWLVLGAVLLGSAGALHAGWWAAVPLVVKRGLGVALGIVLVCFIATQALIARDFNDSGEDNLDYIIVLGAQVRPDGPSVVLKHRLDKACEYLNRNPSTRCIVTGGRGTSELVTEAEGMATYLIAHGIDPNRIIREERATSTDENITFSMEFVDPASAKVGIVTSNFHVFRGVSIARKAGFAHVRGIAAHTTPFFLPNNLVRESFGIALDFATGHL